MTIPTLCTCDDEVASGTAFDTLPIAVWVFDTRDRIVGWNRAAGDLYGLATEYAVGQSVLLFIPHRDLVQFTRACEAVRQTGAWAGDLITQTAIGQVRQVEARWAAGPDGTVIAVHTDITERLALLSRQQRSARWQATRRLAAAVAAEHLGRLDLRQFAADPDPTANPVVQVPGEWVLVAIEGAVVRELTAAALDAVGYHVIAAADLYDSIRKLKLHHDRVRTAVLGFGPANSAVADELRRVRPMLPVIAIGPNSSDQTDAVALTHIPTPPDPGELLCSVAVAVAGDRLNDVGLFADEWDT